MIYITTIVITVLTFAIISCCYFKLVIMSEGTPEMAKLASTIRSGAHTFMRAEYKIIVPAIVIVAAIFSLFIEVSSGLTFALGATMSSVVCILGMRSASYANVRTANTALQTKSIGATIRTAMLGGSISGLSVHSFGLFGLTAILLVQQRIDPSAKSSGLLFSFGCNPYIMRLTTYSLGCSLVALFNRVAGGNYTKAADIGADYVGKITKNLPEDDHRNPGTIADFVGDMVNDIAGNCSDLLESFVATIVASIVLAVSSYPDADEAFTEAAIRYPVILAGLGLISSIIGIVFVLLYKNCKKPESLLDTITYLAATCVAIFGGIASFITFGNSRILPDDFQFTWTSPWIAFLTGVISGVAIGKLTEHYTGLEGGPIKQMVRMAKEGIALLVTEGDALGACSALAPIAIISISMLIAYILCGVYGISIAAVGMMSFIGVTVSIDAFGPIADNAGGIAESVNLPHEVRIITDELDARGNTTAAIGKGFAIGSAAFATCSLIVAYITACTSGVLELKGSEVIIYGLIGMILGAGFIVYFWGLLTRHTSRAAMEMADEIAKQLDQPGVMEGEKEPDYDACIRIATKNAIGKMLSPTVICLFTPVVCGFLFGPALVGGILVGATIVAIPVAIFMGNSGGAFDNTKKYIESGLLDGYGKGSEVHKTAVAGDTVGDTRKDVVGVALDIAIKLMSTVANTLAPAFMHFHLL